MSTTVRIVTWGLLALPVVFAVAAVRIPEAHGLAWPAGMLLLLYAAIALLWRPSRFELRDRELRIHFPLRTLTIPREELIAAQLVRGSELRERIGFALRIGAGGLFGAFGWLWTRKLGMIEMYVSCSDSLLLLTRRHAMPLLITPARAAELHASLALPPTPF